MSYFWSSTTKGTYIEPKRQFQAIGIVEFAQPFLIQSMDKPSFSTISTSTVKKFLKNGTIKVENHYNTGYDLKDISMTIIDAYDSGVGKDLNKAQTLFDLLSNGGYTLRSNQIGTTRELLRFPTFQILELAPVAKSTIQNATNTALSAIGNAAQSLLGGGGIGDVLDAVSSATNFLGPNVVGIWTLQDPVISSVGFGGFSYNSDNIVTIDLGIKYNNFKYEKSFT